MLKDLFKKSQYATVPSSMITKEEDLFVQKPNIPNGMWNKCSDCGSIIYIEDLNKNNKVCTNCGFHFRMSASERIKLICDENTFNELFSNVCWKNQLDFEGYEEKLRKNKYNSGIDEAVVTGVGNINGFNVALAIMDSNFMMGSMGTVVGEKITRLIEYSIEYSIPLIIFTASGGARMQEGIFSLMQMAKISAALGKHDECGLLYITVITHPTTGGVTASFAMDGDIIISEPKALIGFAGRRVIENTIKEKLPEYFQSAEFVKEKGFIDSIVKRGEMKRYLTTILKIHGVKKNE